MTLVTEYIIKDGDRWDSVANQAFGDSSKISDLSDINPDIPFDQPLQAGQKMFVPIIAEEANISDELLPPWKR